MPKTQMSTEEIEQYRGRILDTALDVIIADGFNNLSLRKIASRLGVTATTIYNYFKNKDELNLMIRVRGFEKLFALLTEEPCLQEDIEARLNAMFRAYIHFGLTYPSYYDIMFNLHTPKYLDYVGTDMETTAHYEKQTALKCLDLFADPINDYLPADFPDREAFISYQVVRFWSDLHGLVTLNNSRLFHEVMDDVANFIEKRTAHLVADIMKIKQMVDKGKPVPSRNSPDRESM